MPAQFNLTWDNTTVSGSGNVTGQTVSLRKKSTGGAFITLGFLPPNPIVKTVNAAASPNTLDFNNIYEFKLETLCTVNGPTLNSNGIVEQIAFQCLVPVLTVTDITAKAVLDIAGTSILKARFKLVKISDSSVVYGPIIINPVGTLITANAAGLTATTNYKWEIELYTVINGVEVVSSAATYLNGVCQTPTTTLATVACPAPSTLTVTN